MPVQTRSGNGKYHASHCIWKLMVGMEIMELVTHAEQWAWWSHVQPHSWLPLTAGKGNFQPHPHLGSPQVWGLLLTGSWNCWLRTELSAHSIPRGPKGVTPLCESPLCHTQRPKGHTSHISSSHKIKSTFKSKKHSSESVWSKKC